MVKNYKYEDTWIKIKNVLEKYGLIECRQKISNDLNYNVSFYFSPENKNDKTIYRIKSNKNEWVKLFFKLNKLELDFENIIKKYFLSGKMNKYKKSNFNNCRQMLNILGVDYE